MPRTSAFGGIGSELWTGNNGFLVSYEEAFILKTRRDSFNAMEGKESMLTCSKVFGGSGK